MTPAPQSLALSIATDHPAYAGHFPGQPILPGVVLLDEAIHALADYLGQKPATGEIKAAKFLQPVTPGTPLILHFSATPSNSFNFAILDGDRTVASGTLSFSMET